MALTQDQGFKRLLGSYPDEALELFVPELLASRGKPISAVLLATEIPPLTPDASHRLMDLAVQFNWSDGNSAVVVLIEHWSSTPKIDLVRVLRYVVELRLRHPDTPVLPVLLVTDERAPATGLTLVESYGGWESLRFTPRVVHLRRPDAIPPGQLTNHVALMLAALAPVPDPIGHVIALIHAYRHLPNAREDLRALLPFMLQLANITSIDDLDRTCEPPASRLRQDTAMIDIFEFARTEGRTEGRTEVLQAMYLSLQKKLQDGIWNHDHAISTIEEWLVDGILSHNEYNDFKHRIG